MPGPTLDEYNAALAELSAQSGGQYQSVAPEEFMSMDPSVQFMSQPEFAPGPGVAAGPPAAMLSPQDQMIQQFALQLQAKEEQNAAAPADDGGPDPLADFAARMAPGIEPEAPMARYQSVNPYVARQEAPAARPPTFRPRRGGGGGVGGLMGRMERDARATGLAAQQEADTAAAARDEALEARRASIEAAGQARQESLQRQAALKRAENEAILDEIKQRESDQNVAQAKREMFLQDYDRAQVEADRMLPPRDRRSRQTVAMGALAVALSGFGDAIAASGGTRMNSMQTTLGIIDDAVERDLQAQREAKRDAQGKADRALHRLDVFDKVASTEQSASLAREAAIRAEYAGYMEVAAKEYEGTVTGQQAIEASQALRQQSEALKAQSADVEAQQALGKAEALQLKRAQMQAAAAGGPDPMKRLKIEEQALRNQKLRAELSGDGGSDQDIPGYRRVGKVSAQSAQKARDIAMATAGFDRDMARYEELRKKNAGGVGWSAADAREADVIAMGLADKASQMAGGGQAGEAARAELMETLGNPTDYAVFSDPLETYRQVRRHFKNVADAQLETLGFKSKAQAAQGAFRPRR